MLALGLVELAGPEPERARDGEVRHALHGIVVVANGAVVETARVLQVIFDIDGFGLLGFNSIVDRDYPVVMGILLISSLLLLVGNILSDVLVAVIDPRIRFR